LIAIASKEPSQGTVELKLDSLLVAAPMTLRLPLVGGEPKGVDVVAGCPKHGDEAFPTCQSKTTNRVASHRAVRNSYVFHVRDLQESATVDMTAPLRTSA
jgi:hypothetical protein